MKERPGHQRPQVAQGCAGHPLRRLAREPAAKDGRRLEHLTLVRAEQAPRVVKDGPHAALPRRHVAPLGLQKVEAVPDLGQYLGRGQNPRPCRGQLDGQGQSLQPGADLGHRRGVPLVEAKVGVHGAHALGEQLHCLHLGKAFQGRQIARVRGDHRRHLVLEFGIDLQRRPAGGQDLESGGSGEQLVQGRRGGQQVLKVVDHQHQTLVPQSLL